MCFSVKIGLINIKNYHLSRPNLHSTLPARVYLVKLGNIQYVVIVEIFGSAKAESAGLPGLNSSI